MSSSQLWISLTCYIFLLLLIASDGKVFTFGMGRDGQTGQGDRMNIFFPKVMAAFQDSKISQVACGMLCPLSSVLCLLMKMIG